MGRNMENNLKATAIMQERDEDEFISGGEKYMF